MRSEKREQLQLLTWFLIIVGPAMAIPGSLVFGMIDYVCGYLILSALLLACVLVAGNVSHFFRRSGKRTDLKTMAPDNWT